MSIVLTGNPGNVTPGLAATVIALANNGSGAVRVQTSTPHLFGDGDKVGVVAPPVVGSFTITVIDSTHFDLVGSTYTTTGTGTATDMALAPQIQVPTDGDTKSIQISGLLSTIQALTDRDQFIWGELFTSLELISSGQGTASPTLATTWSAPIEAVPGVYDQGVGNSSPEWDPIENQWLIPAVAGTADANVYCSYDGLDEVWRPLDTPMTTNTTVTAISCGKDPDAVTYYMGLVVPAGLDIMKSTGSGWSAALLDAAANYTDVQIASFGGYAIVATGHSSDNSKVNLITSNNQFGTHGTTNVGATVAKVLKWLLRSNASLFVAAPYSGNGGYATPFLYTSTDGHTFTLRPLSFLPGTDTIVGLDYGRDALGACWIMAVVGGGNGRLYRSVDGITWALQTTLTTLGLLQSIAAIGPVWVGVFSSSGTSPHSLVYSLDTTTWYLASAKLAEQSTLPARVRSNGIQFCANDTNGARFTAVQGPIPGALT